MHLQFQTNEFTPAPYAHAIELHLDEKGNKLNVVFELTYMGREELELDEILQEGFSENDDLKWEGTLNQDWLTAYKKLVKQGHLKKKTDLEESENYWQIKTNGESGYPVDEQMFLEFIQEIQQAVFESLEIEAPLKITILRKDRDQENKFVFNASFVKRTFERKNGESRQAKDWSELNSFLKEVFWGDFRPEQAMKKSPGKSGLFLNIGDNLWYEIGKSYLIQPSKLTQFLD